QVETLVTTKKGKRKAEKKASEDKSAKKKKQVVAVSDSDTYVEADVLDIMTSGKNRIGGRIIPANIPPAPMDMVFFHSEESAQKWSACSEGSEEFRKVRVRGKDVKFSPTTINEYLGRNPLAETDEANLLQEITKEITGGIGAANWAPTNHGFGITPMLAKMIFQIGTKRKINFGEHVFNQTMKHANTFAIKLLK
ncbi:envelope-like protein, partial [Trifolium medium]|nr:envelope-like protein [Trifolium medium]